MENKSLDICLAPIYEPIWKKRRLKIFFGGRGAGRTHSIARYILIRSMRENLRIWCARETQKSIAQSVHHVFVELISLYGLNQYFSITKDDITCTKTGSFFMFKGFRGDGGQYSAEGLKAYEDFDILWIEEAAACSMESLNVVSKTIRKEGSEIIASFNRVLEEDPIWRFGCYGLDDIYEKKVHIDDDRIVIYATVDDNCFASDTFLKERELDRQRLRQEEFDQVWLGYPNMSGGEAIFFPRNLLYNYDLREPMEDEYNRYEIILGIDPSGGRDRTAMVARQGSKVLSVRVLEHLKDSLDLAYRVLDFKNEVKADKCFCDRGYGQSILAIASQSGEKIMPVDFGGTATDALTYKNKRAEMYGKARDWLYAGGFLGKRDDPYIADLRRELSVIETNLRQSDDSRICLKPKDDIRKKIGASPDIADAFVLTFAGFKDRIVKNKFGMNTEEYDDYRVNDYGNYDFRKF